MADNTAVAYVDGESERTAYPARPGHLRMLWTVELNAVSEHQREAHLYVIK